MRIAKVNQINRHWSEGGSGDGYRLIRYDKRGHGLSDAPPPPYSMTDLTTDIEALFEHLGITECIYVGLSIGELISQSLAARRPDLVKALVLSNTVAKMGDVDIWQARIAAIQANGLGSIANDVMERWFSPAFRVTDDIRAWQNMFTRTPQDSYIGCCEAIVATDMTHTTADLTLPTLGIAGSEDGASPPALVQATLDLITGSRSVVIDGAGHLPCVEAPNIYAQHLTAFLQEVRHEGSI